MTTRKLLWELAKRGAVWGAITWLLSCLALLCLEQAITSIHPCPLNMQCTAEHSYGENEGFGYVIAIILVSPPVCMIVSSVWGAISGILSGTLTELFLRQVKTRKLYYGLIAATNIVLYSIGGALGLLAIYLFEFQVLLAYIFHPLVELIRIRELGFDPTAFWVFDTNASLPFFSIFIVLCAIFFSNRLSGWYERESAKGIAQNVTPN